MNKYFSLEFLSALPRYVNTRDCQELSGYLLLEETASGAVVFFLERKMYTLVSASGECFKTRWKVWPITIWQTSRLSEAWRFFSLTLFWRVVVRCSSELMLALSTWCPKPNGSNSLFERESGNSPQTVTLSHGVSRNFFLFFRIHFARRTFAESLVVLCPNRLLPLRTSFKPLAEIPKASL